MWVAVSILQSKRHLCNHDSILKEANDDGARGAGHGAHTYRQLPETSTLQRLTSGGVCSFQCRVWTEEGTSPS